MRRLVLACRLLGGLSVALLTIGMLVMPEGGPAGADATITATNSSVTVTGRQGKFDDFSGLRITVSQTKDMISQGVQVSWTGGTPTGPSTFIGRDYLQMMQCWGPDPDAADFRETCQFGMATVPATAGLGLHAATRDVVYDAAGRDPAETLATDAKIVPFRSVSGKVAGPNSSLSDLRSFFSPDTTNEVPYARTAGDGTGQMTFEVQDTTDSPDLGCGDPVAGSTAGRSCWLVIVPRGAHDPAGKPRGQVNTTDSALDGSPLAPTAFANRIVVPLSFQRAGSYCPIGQHERQTVGSELMAAAITSWQPTLCADQGPVFGFSPAGDAEAGMFIRNPGLGAPSVAFVTDPVRRESTDPPMVHAPVALSGAVIAFEIEARVDPGATGDAAKLAGTQFRNLKLTPRLLAKLLTQSYRSDVPNGVNVDYVKNNPAGIRQDQEFLDLNPEFAKTTAAFRPDGIMVTGGSSALARQVWEWVLADDEARAWLAGKADDQGSGTPGMVVNQNYRNLVGDNELESFPKMDPTCVDEDQAGSQPPWCTLDFRPYQGSLQAAAKQTLRGNAQVKNLWDATGTPPAYKTQSPQSVGQRFAISITDSASAQRYNLPTASLRNKAGQFVAPTDQSIGKGVLAMDATEVDGVVRTNPKKAVDGAYPLSMLTYAAVNLKQEKAALADDAKLLRYAAGTGQTSGVLRGQLPPGYVTLPAAQRKQTLAAADTVAAGLPASSAPSSPAAGPDQTGSGNGGTPNGGATTPTPGASSSGPPDTGTRPSAALVQPSASSAVMNPVARQTSGAPLGAQRFLLLVLAIVGAVSLLLGQVLLRWTRGAG